MNEKKDSNLKRYLKENLVVLLFELVIVVLLACICSLMMGGKPAWLAPTLAVFAYLMAELRFMMSYMAHCAKQQGENASSDETRPIVEAEDEFGDIDAVDEDDEQTPFVPPVLKHAEETLDEPAQEATAEPLDEPLDEPLNEPAEESPFEEPADQETDEAVLFLGQMEPTAEEDLLITDIDLFDDAEDEETDGRDDEIYDIFTSPTSKPVRDDLPMQSMLDLGDDEDPFSHG